MAQNKEETQYPFTELEVAASIALGDHGFGKRFTAEQPLSIVVIARDAAELSALRAYVTDRMSSHGNRIRIDGVLRPKKSESEKAAA